MLFRACIEIERDYPVSRTVAPLSNGLAVALDKCTGERPRTRRWYSHREFLAMIVARWVSVLWKLSEDGFLRWLFFLEQMVVFIGPLFGMK